MKYGINYFKRIDNIIDILLLLLSIARLTMNYVFESPDIPEEVANKVMTIFFGLSVMFKLLEYMRVFPGV
jgi:hypothetical protein